MVYQYIETVNVEVILLILLVAGALAKLLKLLDDTAVGVINRLIFNVCIPAVVFSSLAKTEFTKLDWKFVASFLILRLFAAILCGVGSLIAKQTLGEFLIHWIGTTWINSIIFGIPIMKTLFPNSEKGTLYPVLASLSSFIFQLPCLLTGFEIFRKKSVADAKAMKVERIENKKSVQIHWKELGKKIGLKLITNPPIIGIVLGFLFSILPLTFHPILDGFTLHLANIVTPDSKEENSKSENKESEKKEEEHYAFQLAEDVPVIVSDGTQTILRLNRSQFGTTEPIYETIPTWVVDCLMESKVPQVKDTSITFYLVSTDEKKLPQMPQGGKLNAIRIVRVKKVISYIVSKLEMKKEKPTEENIEVLCNNKILDLDLSLATIRQFIWNKPSEEMTLYYRLKQ